MLERFCIKIEKEMNKNTIFEPEWFQTKKIRRAIGPGRVGSSTSCSSAPVVFLFTSPRPRGGPWDPPGQKWTTRRSPGATKSTLGRPGAAFYRFLDDPKRHRKINDFPTSPKTPRMAQSIDPGAPEARFWTKKHDFWGPFWHRFFDFLAPSFLHRFFVIFTKFSIPLIL